MLTGTISGGRSGYESGLAAVRVQASGCLVRSTSITLSPFFAHLSPVWRTSPSPSILSTTPPSAAPPEESGCDTSVPVAPQTPPYRRRWGTACTCTVCPPRASHICHPPKRPAASLSVVGWPGMQWYIRIVAVSPSVRWWTAPSSTVCPAPCSDLPLASC